MDLHKPKNMHSCIRLHEPDLIWIAAMAPKCTPRCCVDKRQLAKNKIGKCSLIIIAFLLETGTQACKKFIIEDSMHETCPDSLRRTADKMSISKPKRDASEDSLACIASKGKLQR